jgi:hypothetical protein
MADLCGKTLTNNDVTSMDYQAWYAQTRAMTFDEVAEQFIAMVKSYNGFIHSRFSFESKSFFQVHYRTIGERLQDIMARANKGFNNDKQSVSMAAKPGNPAWLGFVEIALTDDDLVRVDDLLVGVGKDYITEMTALAKMGKVSIAKHNDSFCATLTVSNEVGTKGLTAWGVDFFDSLFCLYIKASTYPNWFSGDVKAPVKRG